MAEQERKQKRYTICKLAFCEIPTHFHPRRDTTAQRHTVLRALEATFTPKGDPTPVGEKVTSVSSEAWCEHESESDGKTPGEGNPIPRPSAKPLPFYRPPTDEPSDESDCSSDEDEGIPTVAEAKYGGGDDDAEAHRPDPPAEAGDQVEVAEAPPAPAPEPVVDPPLLEEAPIVEDGPVDDAPEPEPDPPLVEVPLEEDGPINDPLVKTIGTAVSAVPIFINASQGLPRRAGRLAGFGDKVKFRIMAALCGTYTTRLQSVPDNPSDTPELHTLNPVRSWPVFGSLRNYFTGVRPTGYLKPKHFGTTIYNQFELAYTHFYAGDVYTDLADALVTSADFAGQRVLTKDGEMNARLPQFCARHTVKILGDRFGEFASNPAVLANTINYAVNRLYYVNRIVYFSAAGKQVRDPLKSPPPSSKECLRKGA